MLLLLRRKTGLDPLRWCSLAGGLLTAVLLQACATTTPLESVSPRAVAAAEALLALSPGAGAVLGVVETGYVNAVEQTIALDTQSRAPGQNYITVQLFETVAHSSTPGGLQDIPLANLDLAGEARGTVSHADMKLSPYFVQNLYGPFGYSMGRTATGDLCMYAWQRIAPEMKPGGGVARGAVNIRALICSQTKSEQELLEIMLQMRVKGVTGQARRAPALVGAYGTIIAPVGAAGAANVLPPPPPRVAVRPPADRAPVKMPEPDGPVRPPQTDMKPGLDIPAPGGAEESAPIVPLPSIVVPPTSDPPPLVANM